MSASAKRMSSAAMIALLAGLVCAYLLSVLALKHFTHLSPGGNLWGQLVLGFALMAAVLTICIRWWRGKDEAQQEAQKWAWYWGGSFGLAALVPVIFVMTFDNDRPLTTLLAGVGSRGDVGMAFVIGIIATLLPMCVGAGIAWVVWWRRHR